MSKNIYRFKGNFKSFLFAFGALLILCFLYYTQLLVKELQVQSREFLSFRAKIFEENINSEDVQDLSFFFNEVIQTADYPVIYTDTRGEPAFWRNVGLPTVIQHPLPQDTLKKLKDMVEKFDKINEPIPISYEGNVLGYYHYGESQLIQQLKWLPYIEIAVAAIFILIGYAGFSSIKKSEERLIWVGMAKETAHQLGTPLSSLIGWIEYLKSSPSKTGEIVPEIERDIQRLKKVTNRFSQIGSAPELREEDLRSIVEEILQYFNRRMPSGDSKISLETRLDPNLPMLLLNRDLFSWVLENLVKNAMDAMKGKKGVISITASLQDGQKVYIDIQDQGKGMSSRERKNIFKPGYSTKKRGWGLGLSLAKRIVEEYHDGSIELKHSTPDKGSVFRITLNVKNIKLV